MPLTEKYSEEHTGTLVKLIASVDILFGRHDLGESYKKISLRLTDFT